MIPINVLRISMLAAFLSVQAASAIEPLSREELASHCAHYSEGTATPGVDATFCVRYIQGFIDGAITTDERVVQNVRAELSQEETFSERAIRLRASRRLKQDKTYYADFCLGSPVPLIEVVAKVVQNLRASEAASGPAMARKAVYDTLLKEYPCKAE